MSDDEEEQKYFLALEKLACLDILQKANNVLFDYA